MKAGARKLAKEQGLKYYVTGNPCKHGHISKRFVHNGECFECQTIRWKSSNKIDNAKRSMKYYWEHRDLVIAKSVERHRLTGFNAQRRAARLQATPPWADMKAIREIYARCPKGYHVDHVIPLKGNNVCGLHVADNLQIIPAKDNLRKGNKLLLD